MEDTHEDKRAHTMKPHHRTPPSSFGLFSEDEETEDDEQTQRVREWERQRVSKVGTSGALSADQLVVPESHPEIDFGHEIVANDPLEPQQPRPKLTWLQKLDATMKEREAELAAQEAENTKVIYQHITFLGVIRTEA